MENEKQNFKQIFIKMCKEVSVKIIGLFFIFFFYYLVILSWLHGITYLMEQFPARKMELNYLGIFGLGYVVITFFLYMMKTFDRKEWYKD